MEDLKFVGPQAKDYSDLSVPLLAHNEETPYSFNYVMEMARSKDAQGKKSLWYMKGGPEREVASNIYQVAEQIAMRIYGSKSDQYLKVLKESGQ